MFPPTTAVLVITSCLLAGASIVLYTVKNGISPMPTSAKVRRRLLSIIWELRGKTEWCSVGNIYELGSGWGTLACAISRQVTDTTVVACENSPLPYLFTVVRTKLGKYHNLALKRQNFYRLTITPAELVVCYLSTEIMAELSLKFQRELRPGTIIISHTFALPGWQPKQIIYVNDLYRTPIYVYCVPRTTLAATAQL